MGGALGRLCDDQRDDRAQGSGQRNRGTLPQVIENDHRRRAAFHHWTRGFCANSTSRAGRGGGNHAPLVRDMKAGTVRHHYQAAHRPDDSREVPCRSEHRILRSACDGRELKAKALPAGNSISESASVLQRCRAILCRDGGDGHLFCERRIHCLPQFLGHEWFLEESIRYGGNGPGLIIAEAGRHQDAKRWMNRHAFL